MAKSAALWGALATIALCLVLAGLGFLFSGLFIWLVAHLGAALAATLTGVALLLAAAIITLVGGLLGTRRKQPEPSPMAELAIGLAAVALEAFANRRKTAKPEA